METAVIRRKRSPISVAIVAVVTVVLGILFVNAFTISWRAVALFPLAAGFFLCCALFLNHLREFLLFSLMFAHLPWREVLLGQELLLTLSM
jgi:hypothetical protein